MMSTFAKTAVCLVFLSAPLFAQDEESVVPESDAVRRLPPHYSEVVTEKQREQIYVLQGEYKTKLDALIEQIQTLRADRDKAIEAVLSPTQREQVQLRQEAARIKREKLVEEKRIEREKEQKAELQAELDKLRKELEAIKASRTSAGS